MIEDLDALEMELRRLPGVRMVSFEDHEDVLVVQLGVADDVDTTELRRRATAAAGDHIDRPVMAEVACPLAADAQASPRGRVRVLAVIDLPDGEIEVHLAAGNRRTIGRRSAPDPAEAAVASTLAALVELGLDIPFGLRWSGPVADPSGRAVAVMLAKEGVPDRAGPPGTGESGNHARYGVAAAEAPAEAATRATLDALNRFLTPVTS